jgi:hypothetical protein
MADIQTQRVKHADEPARGIDGKPEDRPGVPMEREVRREPHVSWAEPERMKPVRGVTKRAELDRLPPVFSPELKPHGLNGLLRRYAYTVPEHKARKWLTLMLADRLAVLERRLTKLIGLSAMVWGGVFALRTWRRA